YGDPCFNSKVDFVAIDPAVIEAPWPLSHPHGWLGQTLVAGAVDQLSGRCACVAAFNDAKYW
ncbi:MAG: GNAT family N-acetyltransferase, partial [Planctomycetota bacterium]